MIHKQAVLQSPCGAVYHYPIYGDRLHIDRSNSYAYTNSFLALSYSWPEQVPGLFLENLLN